MKILGALRSLALVFGWTVGGCTFTGLADYDIPTCNPGAASQAADVCDALNRSTTCTPYRCNAETSHCAVGVRDDDHDGNPPIACGGTDCDDNDPLNGGKVELCDGRDNNCNGLVDEGLSYAGAAPTALIASAPSLGAKPDPWIAADSSGIIGNVVATASTSESVVECIDVYGLDSVSANVLLGQTNAVCSFLSTDARTPRQPFAKRLGAGMRGTATVFVETSGCAQGALGYRWFEPPGSTGSFDELCPSGAGVPANGTALPAVEDISAENDVAILFYDAPVASREGASILSSCAGLAPAMLYAMVAGYGAVAGGPPMPVASGIATAAPGSVAVAGVGALVAAPVSSTNAGAIFLVTVGGAPALIAALPDFANARAIGLGVAPAATDGTIPVAAVAELGCAPQRIVVAFGTLDPTANPPTLAMGAANEVWSSQTPGWAIRPSIAWQEHVAFASGARTEWLVTWTVSLPGAMARRYGASGSPLSEAFEIGRSVVDAVPGPDGRVFVLDAAESTFESISLECPVP